MEKKRLDLLLVEKGLETSRERAKALIMLGVVYVNGEKAQTAGETFPETALVEVRGSTLKYVSRGGLKLEKALEYFSVDPKGMTAIDAGASTGGFTDCLLQNGAEKVYAADVGYGQLAWSLRTDPRVVCMERCNVRHLTPEDIGEPLDLAVMDVSFISIKLIIPVLKTLLSHNGQIISLIKPQFEAGREKVGKHGVVREKSTHIDVIEDILSFSRKQGFAVRGLTYSPIRGPEGNIEFLVLLGQGQEDCEINVQALVESAHDNTAK